MVFSQIRANTAKDKFSETSWSQPISTDPDNTAILVGILAFVLIRKLHCNNCTKFFLGSLKPCESHRNDVFKFCERKTRRATSCSGKCWFQDEMFKGATSARRTPRKKSTSS